MCDSRLKAELENFRIRRDTAIASMQSAHDSELSQLREQLTDSESVWRVQVERAHSEYAEQIDNLRREMRDLKERNEAARLKADREKNLLESELTKVNI